MGMVMFGSGTPVSKLVIENFPQFVASDLRMAVTVLVLAPWAWSQRQAVRDIQRLDWLYIGLIALIGMVGYSVAILNGIKMVSGVCGSIITSTVPAVTAFASYVFLRERLGWRKSFAIALGVSGVLLTSITGGSKGGSGMLQQVLGAVLVFAAVCSDAAHTLLAKLATGRVRPLLVIALAAGVASILIAAPAVYQATEFDFSKPGLPAWLALLWWGAGTTASGALLWYSGLRRVPASEAAGFMAIGPVVAVVLSYVLLGDSFYWIQAVGFLLALSGVGLIAWKAISRG